MTQLPAVLMPHRPLPRTHPKSTDMQRPNNPSSCCLLSVSSAVTTIFSHPKSLRNLSVIHSRRESTGAPRSPKRTPDFLSSLLALANFTRLSLMKAAHAGLGGRPVQEIRIRGPKTMGAAQRSLSLDYRQISICFHKSIDSCHGTVPQGRLRVLRVAQDDSPGYKIRTSEESR